MALTISAKAQPYFGNQATQDDSGTNYTQRYLVKFSNFTTASAADLQLAESQALFANGVPSIGDTFRGNRAAFCKSKQASVLNQDNKPVGVIVTCVFSTIGTPQKDEESDPLKKRPDITWSPIFEREAVQNCRLIKTFTDGQKPIEVARGKRIPNADKLEQINNFSVAVTNSFGDPPTPFPEKDVPYMQWTIVQNLPVFDVKQAIALLSTVNVKEFRLDGYNILPGQNLLVQRSAVVKYQGVTSYREVTTSGIIKTTHDAIVLDNGPSAYGVDNKPSAKWRSGVNTGGKIKRDGQEVIARLDGKGNFLDDDKPDVFAQYAIYPAADHVPLQLPTERL
jgi:hypothetical protein